MLRRPGRTHPCRIVARAMPSTDPEPRHGLGDHCVNQGVAGWKRGLAEPSSSTIRPFRQVPRPHDSRSTDRQRRKVAKEPVFDQSTGREVAFWCSTPRGGFLAGTYRRLQRRSWWRWEELNLRHGAYETPALPLSYTAVIREVAELRRRILPQGWPTCPKTCP